MTNGVYFNDDFCKVCQSQMKLCLDDVLVFYSDLVLNDSFFLALNKISSLRFYYPCENNFIRLQG